MSQPSLLPDDFEPEPGRAGSRPDEPDWEPDAPAQAASGAALLAADAGTLDELRERAAGCTACDLHRDATQTVFGEGDAPGTATTAETIRLVFVGEQPGDSEDVEGRPFVGPAGKLFDRALLDAGIDRGTAYVTNMVKHFKWTPRPTRGPGFRGTGKRRIHQTPNTEEVKACRPWLDAELRVLQPDLVVLLGATAAKAVLGSGFRVTKQRGELLHSDDGLRCMATVHPSSVLRADDDRKQAAYDDLVDDLRAAAAVLT